MSQTQFVELAIALVEFIGDPGAVLVVALLSGLFFLVNENTRLRRELHQVRIEQRTFSEQPAVIAPADTTAAE